MKYSYCIQNIELKRNLQHEVAHSARGKEEAVDPNDTTKWYRASPQHQGRVGFITSMSRYLWLVLK